MAKGNNNNLLINLGVALDKLQIDEAVKELQSILLTKNTKGKMVLKAKYEEKDIENIKQIRDKIAQIEETAKKIKIPQELKRDMGQLKIEASLLKNNIQQCI